MHILTLCSECKKKLIVEGKYEDRNKKYKCHGCLMDEVHSPISEDGVNAKKSIKYQDIKPSRNLDATVAVNILGWFWQNPFNDFNHIKVLVPPIGDKRRHWAAQYKDGIPHWLPKYSTNISDAWQVVEKIKEHFWTQIDEGKGNPICTVGKYGIPGSIQIEAETVPLVICLAALKAVGYEFK